MTLSPKPPVAVTVTTCVFSLYSLTLFLRYHDPVPLPDPLLPLCDRMCHVSTCDYQAEPRVRPGVFGGTLSLHVSQVCDMARTSCSPNTAPDCRCPMGHEGGQCTAL